MPDEDLNAPVGGQPTMPEDTIATETASVGPSTPAPVVAPPEEPEPETAEQQSEETAEQPESVKPDKMDWRERRRNEETNRRKQVEAELAAERAEKERFRLELERIRAGTATPNPADPAQAVAKTPDQIRAEAREEAKREIMEEQQRQSFAEATGRVLQAGLQAYPDFAQKRDELVQYFGETLNARPDFFDAIINLDNGHDVFYALAADPEQAEQVLAMPTTKMVLKLSQLASSATPKKTEPKPKPISKAPAPITPVAGAPQATNRLDDETAPMDAWAETFLKQMAGKGR